MKPLTLSAAVAAAAAVVVITPLTLPAAANAQLSRDEHDRLRLELRQGLHRPVRVGTLQELGLPARLTASERRLLRRQLREQHGAALAESPLPATGRPADVAARPDTSDSVGGEVSEPDMPGRVVPASTAHPDTIRLNSSMLDVPEPVSVSN